MELTIDDEVFTALNLTGVSSEVPGVVAWIDKLAPSDLSALVLLSTSSDDRVVVREVDWLVDGGLSTVLEGHDAFIRSHWRAILVVHPRS